MVAIHETAHPRFKYNATKSEIRSLYSPNEAEQRWMRSRRLDPDLQQAHIVYLKCFQRLGYFPSYSDIPRSVREHIAESIGRRRVGQNGKIRWLWALNVSQRSNLAMTPIIPNFDKTFRIMFTATALLDYSIYYVDCEKLELPSNIFRLTLIANFDWHNYEHRREARAHFK